MPSELTQNVQLLAKDPNNAADDLLSMTQERAEVLDHNARLYFDLDPSTSTTNLYSFYCEYQDYLDERNLVDPDQYQEKKQKAAAAEQHAKENQTNSSAA